MSINNLTQLKELISTTPEAFLVDFYKDDCRPCKMLALSLKNYQTNNSDALVIHKVRLEDIGEEAFHEFGVMSTPTLVLFKDHEEQKRHSGFLDPKQLQAFLA